MVQFNLLPDVKLEYIRARRTKRTVIMTSVIVSGAVFAIFLLLFTVVNVAQKQHLSHLQEDINNSKKELQSKPELAKILTIQNQLNSLPALHKQKPVATRVAGYVQKVTPKNVSIASLVVNFKDQTIKIDGSADSLATVNTFTDTLKFTNFTTSTLGSSQTSSANPKLAFNSVVLANFSVNSSSTGDKNKTASYSITLKYDPAIFSSDNDVTLLVASKVTTRSETEKPGTIFQSNPVPQQGEVVQ